MEAQYIQFSKKEGKFILQQQARNKEKTYQIEQEKETIMAALFYQDYIHQHIENTKLRSNLLTLIEKIQNSMTKKSIIQNTAEEDQAATLSEFQLRRDKEIGEREEEKKYITIKQIILPTLQSYIKKITKDKNVSSDEKQEILNLTKKL